MRTRSWYSVFAPVGVAVYVVTVIVGAALYPGYSHLKDTVSSLTNPTAPNLAVMNGLFTVYNLCGIVFGIAWAADRRTVSAAAKASAASVALAAFLGLVLYFFPQDRMGDAITARGTAHIAIAGTISLLTMAALLLRGLADRRQPEGRGRAVYSFVSLAAVFVTGGLAAMGVARGWAVGGLLERLTIGSYLQWLVVEGLLP